MMMAAAEDETMTVVLNPRRPHVCWTQSERPGHLPVRCEGTVEAVVTLDLGKFRVCREHAAAMILWENFVSMIAVAT